eukprot:CCRYP_001230-RB/>CCRYP_001230-RB protein AED:0.42 eAED:0.63 QI:414/0/0.5/1/1/1/2/0/133
MSKQVSKKWIEVDALTRAIFKELAAEDSKRYKKNRSAPMTSFRFDDEESKEQPTDEKNQVQTHGQATRSSSHRQSHITEVDVTDKEIISMAISFWGLSPPVVNSSVENNNDFVYDDGIGDFLSGIDWNMYSQI